jgi:hypothetical protein
MTNILHSAASVDHYTPADWCEDFRYILGGRIALDPASNAFANQVVGAEIICSTHGLEVDWNLSLAQVAPGGVLLNPPGKSPENPGGASVWWHKLVYEWEVGQRSWSAIFVGFSLEILQTAQSYPVLQPGDFPHAVPDKRICFDVETQALYERLRQEMEKEHAAHGLSKKYRSMTNRMDLVQAALNRGELRFPGDSPTHGNVISCLAHDVDTMVRFYERMEKRGWTDRKTRCR